MQRFIFLTILIYALLLTGLATINGGFIALAIPFALYLFFGFWNAVEKLDLQVERHLSNDRTAPDAEVVVTVTVRNLGDTIAELNLVDRISPTLEVRLGSNRQLIRLPKGSSYTFTYSVAGPRGKYIFNEIYARASDFTSLIQREAVFHTHGQLFVFPDVRKLKSVSIRPRRTRVYAGMIPARVGGSGTEFFGVREYEMGDSPRSINWRVSARHEEALFSNEYHQERVADVGIVLDARAHVNEFHKGASIFDHSVLAAGTLADAFISQGNRVGLLVYGNFLSWTLPGYGKVQREKIMNALASADVGASSVFAGLEYLPARMFPPESQIVLVSPLVNDDLKTLVQLRARGYQVMVISPDPILFESKLLPHSKETELAMRVVRMERDLLIRRIERAGIQVTEWDVSIPLDQAIGPRLMRLHVRRFA
jgi:uncharacterized protein (DUF58 family)